MAWTKEYNKEYMKEYYKNNKDRVKNINKKNYLKNKEKRLKQAKNWSKNNKIKTRKYKTTYRLKHPEYMNDYYKKNKKILNERVNNYNINNPEKYRAKYMANNHNLREFKCKSCNSTINLEGHHPDYSKPLYIITLCSKCHYKLHHNKLCLLDRGDKYGN